MSAIADNIKDLGGGYKAVIGEGAYFILKKDDKEYVIIDRTEDGKLYVPEQTDKLARLYRDQFQDLDGKDKSILTLPEFVKRVIRVTPPSGDGAYSDLFEMVPEKTVFEFIDDDPKSFELIEDSDIVLAEEFESLKGRTQVSLVKDYDNSIVSVLFGTEDDSARIDLLNDEDNYLHLINSSDNAEEVLGKHLKFEIENAEDLPELESLLKAVIDGSKKIEDSFSRREPVVIELPSGDKLAGLYDEEHKGKHLVMVGDKVYSVDDDHIEAASKRKKIRLPENWRDKIESELKSIEDKLSSLVESDDKTASKQIKKLEARKYILEARKIDYENEEQLRKEDSTNKTNDMSKVKDAKEFKIKLDSLKKDLNLPKVSDDSGEEQYDRGVKAGREGLEKGWTKGETAHYYEELHKQFMEGLEKGFSEISDSVVKYQEVEKAFEENSDKDQYRRMIKIKREDEDYDGVVYYDSEKKMKVDVYKDGEFIETTTFEEVKEW